MKTRVSFLAPILRSDTVGQLLAELLLHPQDEYSLADLQRATGAQSAVVHREVLRFIESGLLTDRRVGRNRQVTVNPDYPLLRPLTELITATYGPVPVLRAALEDVDGVDEALIYGSWAARLAGMPGPFPHDIDVLVVGAAHRQRLHEIAGEATGRLRLDVNITRVASKTWADGQDPFVATVRSRPTFGLVSAGRH